jgi:hypothetical protein
MVAYDVVHIPHVGLPKSNYLGIPMATGQSPGYFDKEMWRKNDNLFLLFSNQPHHPSTNRQQCCGSGQNRPDLTF